MGGFNGRLALGTCTGLIVATLSVAAGQALAAPVQYYFNFQPIEVCPTGATLCAPINETQNIPGFTNPQVGFVAPNGTDITSAILAQAGIRPSYLPVEMITSPSNLSVYPNTFQVFPGTMSEEFGSTDLMTAAQQPGISNTPPVAPVPPIMSAYADNEFFTYSVQPTQGLTGIYFGASLIGRSGSVFAENIFGSYSAIRQTVIGAVPDALAHEIVHFLGLLHDTDNPGQPVNNLMSVPRTEPTISNALTQLAAGTADQLNSGQISQILYPNGPGTALNPFLNPIPQATTTVTDPDANFSFDLAFNPNGTTAGAGRPGETLDSTLLVLPTGLSAVLGSAFDYHSSNPNVSVEATPLSDCGPDENQQCVQLDFYTSEEPGLGGTDSVDVGFPICVGSIDDGCMPATTSDLTGASLAYEFSDGYQTSTLLESEDGPALGSDSWFPDLTTPTTLDMSMFTPFASGSDASACITQPGMPCPPLEFHADRYDQLIFETPEPSSLAIVVGGLGVWLVIGRRRRGNRTLLAA